MNERLYNYNDYDKLVLYVKDSKTKTIIESYQKLGWQLLNSVSNHRYRDIMDLTFIRPHKIKNKDILQILQVNMEVELNNLAKVEKNKYVWTLCFGISAVTIGLGLIIWGIIQLFNWGIYTDKILGFINIFAGLLIFCLIYFITPKIYRKDISKYEYYNKKYTNNLTTIYMQIEKAIEVSYDKNSEE